MGTRRMFPEGKGHFFMKKVDDIFLLFIFLVVAQNTGVDCCNC